MNCKDPVIRCRTFEAQLNDTRADLEYNYEEDRDYTDQELAEMQADLDYMDFKDNPDEPKFRRLKENRYEDKV